LPKRNRPTCITINSSTSGQERCAQFEKRAAQTDCAATLPPLIQSYRGALLVGVVVLMCTAVCGSVSVGWLPLCAGVCTWVVAHDC
jgi:hypothetical protein